jgi:hypothetical protein
MKELMVVKTAEMVLESGCEDGRIIPKVDVVTVLVLQGVVIEEVVALINDGSN